MQYSCEEATRHSAITQHLKVRGCGIVRSFGGGDERTHRRLRHGDAARLRRAVARGASEEQA